MLSRRWLVGLTYAVDTYVGMYVGPTDYIDDFAHGPDAGPPPGDTASVSRGRSLGSALSRKRSD